MPYLDLLVICSVKWKSLSLLDQVDISYVVNAFRKV